jgi:hypothetical protein
VPDPFGQGPQRDAAPVMAEDERHAALLVDDPSRIGYLPWCRVCGNPVESCSWRRDSDGTVAFEAHCHGESTSGALPAYAPVGLFRLEVFCAEEPRMHLMPVWWVDLSGRELQATPDGMRRMAVEGGAFRGKFGSIARRYAGWIGFGLGMVPWVLWFVLR